MRLDTLKREQHTKTIDGGFMLYINRTIRFFALFLFVTMLISLKTKSVSAQDDSTVNTKEMATAEAQRFLLPRVPALEVPDTKEAWEEYAAALRKEMLDKVYLEHVPPSWLKPEVNVVWGDVISHDGYTIRKLCYEAVPGLWIPAVLYEPDGDNTGIPAVLNVNGHDYENGKAKDVEQIRCINLARRGMLALHPEWFACGELEGPDYQHYNIAYLDVVGVRGVSLFYLAMKRALDVLMLQPRTDPERVAMTGLSGGGWQTAVLSALDERITLTVPVAGHSGMQPRLHVFGDLGDLEQVPSDLLTVGDYIHLTALFAPRPALLIYNQRDNCCFLPENALPATYDPVVPVYQLYGRASVFQYYINENPGTHNYEQDNRLRFYKFINDYFVDPDSRIDEELPCDGELHTEEELYVGLPDDNPSFAELAENMLAGMSRVPIPDAADPEFSVWQEEQIERLKETVSPQDIVCTTASTVADTVYELKSADWTVLVSQHGPENADTKRAMLIVADEGIQQMNILIRKKTVAGKQVLAFDPIYMGGNQPEKRLAMAFEAAGVHLLGVQAGQIMGVCQWARKELGVAQIELCCSGWNASTAALIAAALMNAKDETISRVMLHNAPDSLEALISKPVKYTEKPALFCYGLLPDFDMDVLQILCHGIIIDSGQ